MEEAFGFVLCEWQREVLAGALAGSVGVLVGHPLDTVRIQMQNTVTTEKKTTTASSPSPSSTSQKSAWGSQEGKSSVKSNSAWRERWNPSVRTGGGDSLRYRAVLQETAALVELREERSRLGCSSSSFSASLSSARGENSSVSRYANRALLPAKWKSTSSSSFGLGRCSSSAGSGVVVVGGGVSSPSCAMANQQIGGAPLSSHGVSNHNHAQFFKCSNNFTPSVSACPSATSTSLAHHPITYNTSHHRASHSQILSPIGPHPLVAKVTTTSSSPYSSFTPPRPSSSSSLSSAAASAASSAASSLPTIASTARNIIRNDGFRGFYRGLSAPFLATPLMTMTQFVTYKLATDALQSDTASRSSLLQSLGLAPPPSSSTTTATPTAAMSVAAGMAAGLMQCVVATPVELAKIRVQSQPRFRGVSHCILDTLRNKGVADLYRGNCINAARRAPAFGVYFVTYEHVRSTHLASSLGAVGTGVAGGLAGVAGWIVTYPLDVIKSRFQNDSSRVYRNSWHCAVDSVRKEGMLVLYRGLSATLLRAFPLHAVVFIAYDQLRQRLDRVA